MNSHTDFTLLGIENDVPSIGCNAVSRRIVQKVKAVNFEIYFLLPSTSSFSLISSFLFLTFKGPSLTNRFGPLCFDFLGCLTTPLAPTFGSLGTIIV